MWVYSAKCLDKKKTRENTETVVTRNMSKWANIHSYIKMTKKPRKLRNMKLCTNDI